MHPGTSENINKNKKVNIKTDINQNLFYLCTDELMY